MDLLRPVRLAGEPGDFDTYREALRREQEGSRAWLARMARGQEPFRWAVPRSLEVKVSSVARLRPFHGDTVAFLMDPPALAACAAVQAAVVEGLEELFAEALDPRDLHLTLHDLSNGPLLPDLEAAMDRNETRCREIFASLARALAERPDLAEIRLEPVSLFDCLNISVLLGYAPATERDHRILLNAWEAFDAVVKLGYFLRPHVTMAYFRPRVPTLAEVEELSRRCRAVGPLPPLTLNLWDLAYQRFQDMNRYHTRFRVGDFRSGPQGH